MIKKTIAAAITGVALTGSGLAAAPAFALAPQQAEAVSIQMAEPRCARYPASAFTTTSLKIRKHRVQKGGRNIAIVRVQSQRGTPRGSVKVTILPTRGDQQESRIYQKLRQGKAKVRLPTNNRGRYGVQAKYLPKTCSRFKGSRSDIKYYRVTRRR